MKPVREPARLIPFASFLGAAAVIWDAWWHAVIGRDTFFIPPHDLLYLSLIVGFVALIAQLRIDRKSGLPTDKRLITFLIANLLIFAAAPFDELWHRIFGTESLGSVLVLWSPPHLISLLSFIVGGIAIYFFLLQRFPKDYFLHILQATPVFTTAAFLLSPLEPISLHHLLGFYGAFFITLVSAALLIMFGRASSFRGIATLITLLDFALASISSTQVGHFVSRNFAVPPHDHPPIWLVFFSFLLGGLLIDFLLPKTSSAKIGFVYGLAISLPLYSFAHLFLQPEFVYGLDAAVTAVISAALGGALGGFIVSKLFIYRSRTTQIPS